VNSQARGRASAIVSYFRGVGCARQGHLLEWACLMLCRQVWESVPIEQGSNVVKFQSLYVVLGLVAATALACSSAPTAGKSGARAEAVVGADDEASEDFVERRAQQGLAINYLGGGRRFLIDTKDPFVTVRSLTPTPTTGSNLTEDQSVASSRRTPQRHPVTPPWSMSPWRWMK
jgi:hypothetical protein